MLVLLDLESVGMGEISRRVVVMVGGRRAFGMWWLEAVEMLCFRKMGNVM